MQFLTVRPLADAAITLDFATTIGVAASARVHSALVCLRRGMAAGLLPGVTEVTSAFCSVTMHYDCLQTNQETLITGAAALLEKATVGERPEGRLWDLTCCYAGETAPDMADLAQRLDDPLGIGATDAHSRDPGHALKRTTIDVIVTLSLADRVADLMLGQPARSIGLTQFSGRR